VLVEVPVLQAQTPVVVLQLPVTHCKPEVHSPAPVLRKHSDFGGTNETTAQLLSGQQLELQLPPVATHVASAAGEKPPAATERERRETLRTPDLVCFARMIPSPRPSDWPSRRVRPATQPVKPFRQA
jgi:hypothetical protein